MLARSGGVPEQEGDAPQGGKPHQSKDDAAEGGALAAKQETDQVEPKMPMLPPLMPPMMASVRASLSMNIVKKTSSNFGFQD